MANARNDAYGTADLVLHWLAALLIVGVWTLGVAMDAFPRGPVRGTALSTHMTLGLAVLTLSVLRILWRHRAPAPPPEGPALLAVLARIGHGLLYLLTVAVPVLGLLWRWAHQGKVALLGGVVLPAPLTLPDSRLWGEAHALAAYGLAALVAGHVVAGLFHHLVLRDGTLRRMVPALPR
jgi:superoxide oxidase